MFAAISHAAGTLTRAQPESHPSALAEALDAQMDYQQVAPAGAKVAQRAAGRSSMLHV